MTYFRENEETKLRQTDMPDVESEEEDEYIESDYDDGFDDPMTEDEEEAAEEERREIRRKRFRMASGAWNVIMVIVGTLVILILLGLIFNMISFVMNDADRNFTLFQTRL